MEEQNKVHEKIETKEDKAEEKYSQWEGELKRLLKQLAEDTSLHGFKYIHDNKGMPYD